MSFRATTETFFDTNFVFLVAIEDGLVKRKQATTHGAIMVELISKPDTDNLRLQLVNHVYEMIHDPSAFSKFTHKLSELIDERKDLADVSIALENSAMLAERLGGATNVELSRDIGVLVLGVNRRNQVSHAPPSASEWLGSKFVGDKNGIGWIDTKDDVRNIVHVLQLEGYKHLPVHPILKKAIQAGEIVKLVVVHQFALSDSACGALKDLYGLTPAEIRLCALMAEGRSLKEAAEFAKVKVSTSRGHLKNIFSKIGVNSQSDLVRILTQISAASAIQEFSRKNKISLEPDWKNGLVSIQTAVCKTRFGTRLTYSKFGDPRGKPVLYFHQALGSRLHTRSMAAAAKKHGYLIYKFDRPGYGESPILPHMSIKAVANVTEDLLDHIGAKKACAIGHIVGARTLLDIVPHVNNRIKAIAVYSFRGSFKSSKSTLMNKMNQLVWENPQLMVNFLKIMKLNASDEAIKKNLKKYYQASAADLEILEHDEFMKNRIIEISTRKDFSGTVFDYQNLRSPLPDFSNPAYKIPIKAIFGTDDPFSNPEDSQPYLSQLPQCRILLSEGDGQLHMENNFDRFLSSAFAPIGRCSWLFEQTETP